MGTTIGTGDALNHIRIRWLLAFMVYLYGWGLGTGNRWGLAGDGSDHQRHKGAKT